MRDGGQGMIMKRTTALSLILVIMSSITLMISTVIVPNMMDVQNRKNEELVGFSHVIFSSRDLKDPSHQPEFVDLPQENMTRVLNSPLMLNTTRGISMSSSRAWLNDVRLNYLLQQDSLEMIKERFQSFNERITESISHEIVHPSADFSPPIKIIGDDDFAAQAQHNGWPGNGSSSDPYVIENMTIAVPAHDAMDGIAIMNTTVHFLIRNVSVVLNAGGIFEDVRALHFVNVTNGIMNEVTSGSMKIFLLVENSTNLLISNNTVNGVLDQGFAITFSKNITLRYNSVVPSSNPGTEVSRMDTAFRIYQSHEITLQHNLALENRWYGFEIENSTRITIEDNVITNASWDGMVLAFTPHSRIVNNQFFNTGLMVIGNSAADEIQDVVFNNTVNGKALTFIQNQVGGILDAQAGQVILVNVSAMTIRDQVITDANVGIVALHSTNVTMTNISIEDVNIGIFLFKTNHSAIIETRVKHGDLSGILLLKSHELTILENAVTEFGIGLFNYQVANVLLTDNLADLNFIGVKIDSSSVNITLQGNEGWNNSVSGFWIESSKHINIFNNTLMENGDGILMKNVLSTTIKFSHLINNSLNALSILEGTNSNIIIQNNRIFDNNNGMVMTAIQEVLVRDNLVGRNALNGMFLNGDIHDGMFLNNSIFKNKHGITVVGLNTNLTFTGNSFFFNQGYGFSSPSSSSQDNVTKNNFLQNNLALGNSQAYSISSQDYFAGNYWSDHVAPDIDGDGIVDDPYLIEGMENIKDLTPVVTPHESPFLNLPASLELNGPSDVVHSVTEDALGKTISVTVTWEINTNNPVIYVITENDTILTTKMAFHSLSVMIIKNLTVSSIPLTHVYQIEVTNVFGNQLTNTVLVTINLKESSSTTSEHSKISSTGHDFIQTRINGLTGLSFLMGLFLLRCSLRRKKR